MPNPSECKQPQRSGLNAWLVALVGAAVIVAWFLLKHIVIPGAIINTVTSGQRWKDWTPKR